MFIPGCYCCTPPSDPCTLSGCTWTATEGSDTEFTGDEAYNSPLTGATPDGSYEVTSFQNPDLGNNLPCRQIWIETIGGAHPTVNENVYAINWVDNATHNPSTQCPLTNVSFCVESKRGSDSDSGLTDGVVFVVRQGGKVYATASQPVGKNWKRAYGTYTSSDFTWINGSGSPNFTATGGQLEFGFALRLTVFANTEPFDSVLFDNLCVKPVKECGEACGSTDCDVFNTGTSLTVTQQSSGAAYSVDNATGLSSPSHKFVLPIATGTKSVTAIVSDDIFNSTCASPEGVSVCFNALINPGAGPASVIFRLKQGSTTATIGTASYAGTGTLGWRKTTFSYTIPNPLLFSIATPVSVEMIVSSGTRTDEASVWIDNICLRAIYGDCVDGEFAAIVSGVVLTPKAGAGCNPAWVSQAESDINSTLILTRTSSSGCGFSYSGSAGTVPGRVDYSVSMSLSGWNGTQFTAGTLSVRAGSGGNNMPATYTLAAPFDPCTESGTFNFVSAVGSANCLILSASGSITVSLV